MTDYMKKFIEKHIEIIEHNNFSVEDGLYNACWEEGIQPGELTEVLLTADIDPLEHLTYVPYRYLSFVKTGDKFTIPDNIDTIGTNAFSMSNFKILYLPNSIRVFGEWCFQDSNIEEIIYDGTKAEFFDIVDHGAVSSPIKIKTKDAEFDYWGEW